MIASVIAAVEAFAVCTGHMDAAECSLRVSQYKKETPDIVEPEFHTVLLEAVQVFDRLTVFHESSSMIFAAVFFLCPSGQQSCR